MSIFSKKSGLTFIVKSFKRHDCVRRLVESIRRNGYEQRIIVLNDDGQKLEVGDPMTDIVETEFDIGLSEGRNRMVDLVETDYTVLLDDDFEFTHETDIDRLVAHLEKHKLDLVAGSVTNPDGRKQHYEGRYELKGGVLRQRVAKKPPFHYVFNFFVAKTSTLKKCRWDGTLKLAEHSDFFLTHQGKIKIGYVSQVTVLHHRERDPEYAAYRMRAKGYVAMFMEKHGIAKLINHDGTEYYLNVLKDELARKSAPPAPKPEPKPESQPEPKPQTKPEPRPAPVPQKPKRFYCQRAITIGARRFNPGDIIPPCYVEQIPKGAL